MTKQQMANLRHAAMLMAGMNYASDVMWSAVGLRSPYRFDVPAAAADLLAAEGFVQTVFNIENSVIGNLNTGHQQSLGRIAVNVGALDNSGNKRAAEALKALASAVAKSAEISAELRADLLEQLEELSNQAAHPTGQRPKRSVLRPVVESLGESMQAIGGLAEIWATWGPELRAFLGL